jgi:hypothetical protein
MSACNARPEPPHPFAGTGVACHYAIGHGGPHAWEMPSTVRRLVAETAHGSDDDAQLARLDDVIRFVVNVDLPWLAEWEREHLVGHLTGAVFVSLHHESEPE